jgi:hypothetical protein
MNDLLVGCKVTFTQNRTEQEGIVINCDRSKGGFKTAWVLKNDRTIVSVGVSSLIVNEKDVELIKKNRNKIIINNARVSRGQLIDLG